MQKVILVIHGMRTGKLNQTLHQFTESVFKNTDIHYDIAFLESEEVSFEYCLRHNIEQGYTQIKVVPLMLFTASHYFEDITSICEEWQHERPHLQLTVTQPLGTHPLMSKWVQLQITRYQDLIISKTAIVVLAHGNKRFKEPDEALKKITQQLHSDELPCYPAMVYGDLQFADVLPTLDTDYDRLIIIPFFFYDGFLVNKTKQRIEALHLNADVTFTSAINFHPILKDIVMDRILEKDE